MMTAVPGETLRRSRDSAGDLTRHDAVCQVGHPGHHCMPSGVCLSLPTAFRGFTFPGPVTVSVAFAGNLKVY